MEESLFKKKIKTLLDPYYDREFFTSAIYCIDREKSPRDFLESSVEEINRTPTWNKSLENGFLHLMYAYQASSAMRDNYRWLPLLNALYGLALHRGNGQDVIQSLEAENTSPQAGTFEELADLIRQDRRRVQPKERAWGLILFLMENRTSRSQSLSILLREAVSSCDFYSFSVLVKSLEIAMSTGWKNLSTVLRHGFDLFWNVKPADDFVGRGMVLAQSRPLKSGAGIDWNNEASEELWRRLTLESSESAWTFLSERIEMGLSFDQAFDVLTLLRGRAFYLMDSQQWPRVSRSTIAADVLSGAARLSSAEERTIWLAMSVEELGEMAKLLPRKLVARPSGRHVLDGASKNISKDRLIFRIDDAVDRGLREEALELLSAVVKDQGLSRTLADRLLLMASKQDSWTYDFTSLPVALILTHAFQSAERLKISGSLGPDALFGLVRFFCDMRDFSLEMVRKTGTYGDGMKTSQFDVSGGARIVDRFVFNQLRNSQRVKVWPSDDY